MVLMGFTVHPEQKNHRAHDINGKILVVVRILEQGLAESARNHAGDMGLFTVVQPDEQRSLEAQNINRKMLVRILEQGLAESVRSHGAGGFYSLSGTEDPYSSGHQQKNSGRSDSGAAGAGRICL